MRIIGIDPGSAATGYGILERADGALHHVAHGVLRPREATLPAKLHVLYRTIDDVLERYAPDVAVVEQVFVAASPRSALVLGQARGVVLAALAARGVGVREYAATEVKRAVAGSGRAAKPQMKHVVRRLLALDQTPASDAADALAAAICHARGGRLAELAATAGRPRRRPRRGTAVRVGRLR